MDADKGQWVTSAIRQFEKRLLRYTSRMVGQMNAQEIVQETFLRLWEQDRAKLDGHLAQWLFTVCRNQALDRCRADARTPGESVVPTAAPEPDMHAETKQEKNNLNILVGRLQPAQQEVIRLKFEEDLSYKEISAITGHSVSYVGVLLHESIAELRKFYE